MKKLTDEEKEWFESCLKALKHNKVRLEYSGYRDYMPFKKYNDPWDMISDLKAIKVLDGPEILFGRIRLKYKYIFKQWGIKELNSTLQDSIR